MWVGDEAVFVADYSPGLLTPYESHDKGRLRGQVGRIRPPSRCATQPYRPCLGRTALDGEGEAVQAVIKVNSLAQSAAWVRLLKFNFLSMCLT